MQLFEMWLGSLVPHYLRTRTTAEDTLNRVHELEQAWHAQVEADLAETLKAQANTTSSRHCLRRTGFELSYGPGATSERVMPVRAWRRWKATVRGDTPEAVVQSKST
jgi:hypothetical protein